MHLMARREIEKHFETVPVSNRQKVASEVHALLKKHADFLIREGALPEELDFQLGTKQVAYATHIPQPYHSHTIVVIRPKQEQVHVTNVLPGMTPLETRELAFQHVYSNPAFTLFLRGKKSENEINLAINKKNYKRGEAIRYTHDGSRTGAPFYLGSLAQPGRTEKTIRYESFPGINQKQLSKFLKENAHTPNVIAFHLAKPLTLAAVRRSTRRDYLRNIFEVLQWYS